MPPLYKDCEEAHLIISPLLACLSLVHGHSRSHRIRSNAYRLLVSIIDNLIPAVVHSLGNYLLGESAIVDHSFIMCRHAIVNGEMKAAALCYAASPPYRMHHFSYSSFALAVVHDRFRSSYLPIITGIWMLESQ
jgi:hypothetical protein